MRGTGKMQLIKQMLRIHLNMPSSSAGQTALLYFLVWPVDRTDPTKQALEKVDEIKSFFRQAKAYFEEAASQRNNLNLKQRKVCSIKNKNCLSMAIR